jgi:chromosome segregation protein
MKLKKVEIQGFKTFVDRTTLLFNTGITAVVGPNGCGKSNIVDAIRWVLGENNARTLRGSMMEDIIFNGCSTRPPLGMAEVTLTLGNEDGSAPAQYSAVPEISVTRRVYRDGESECLINKVPCRLKDIADLFMGTGASLYSVIEQGRISSVVSAKPDELRSFIEEAAGITFYRSRKRAALRRIDATQQNLVRVSDILSEISRQIKYLERQARKAERYRELRDRLRLLELNLSHQEIGEIGGQLASLEQEKANLKTALFGIESQSESLGAETETLRLELHGWEGKVQEAQKSLYDAGKSLAEQEKQQEFLNKELADLRERHGNLENDLTRNQLKASMTEEQLSSGATELTNLQTQNQSHRQRLAELEQEHTNLETNLQSQRQQSQQLQSLLMSALTRATTVRNQLAAMEQLDARHLEELNRWQREQSGILAEQQQAQSKHQELSQTRASWQVELKSCEQTLEELRTELEENNRKLEELQEQREEVREERSQVGSRLESMQALEHEGDVEQFIQLSRPVVGSNLLGPVSKLLQVPKEFEKAVEAYLSERLNWVVTHPEVEPAKLMLNIIGSAKVPRATLIPANCEAPQIIPAGLEADTAAGIFGLMSNLVRVNSELKPMSRYLCGQAVIVKDLQTAQKLAAKHPYQSFVTLDGEILVSGAEVTAAQADQPAI